MGDIVPGELANGIHRIVIGLLIDNGAGQQGRIPCRGVVIRMRHPGAVDEVAVGHTEFGGSLVHQIRKALFAAGNMFCQRDSGIVAGLHNQTH